MRALTTSLLLLVLTLAACLLVSCRSRQSDGKSVGTPTIPQPMDDYRIPAWNVGGQIVTGCGAGGKACR